MNKTKIISVIAAAAAAFALTSCEEKALEPCDFSVIIDTTEIEAGVPVPEAFTLNVTNTNTGEITTVADFKAEGSVALLPGVYDFSATAQMGVYNFIATATAVTVAAEADPCILYVSASRASALVIKEVYYVGVKTVVDGKTSSYGKDNYVEIYNNGDETVYLDNLAIGTSSNYNISTVNFANESGNMVDTDGKDTGLKADEYITVNGSNQVVWQIPGDGKTYPLAPGESFLIASSASDHTAANSGSIDLSSAEFETVAEKYATNGQVDNEKSVNLTLNNPLNQNLTNYYMFGMVTTGFVLFYLDGSLADAPTVVNTLASTGTYKAIKKSSVLDAVNWTKNSTTAAFLPADLDAGFVTTGATLTGQSISRRITGTAADGHNVYQDTNNTTDDFQVNEKPVLRRDGAKTPAWSQK